jgi:hypothetical protein
MPAETSSPARKIPCHYPGRPAAEMGGEVRTKWKLRRSKSAWKECAAHALAEHREFRRSVNCTGSIGLVR